MLNLIMNAFEQSGSVWKNTTQLILVAFLSAGLACELYGLLYSVRGTHPTPMDTHASPFYAESATNLMQDLLLIITKILVADPVLGKDSVPLPSSHNQNRTRLCQS